MSGKPFQVYLSSHLINPYATQHAQRDNLRTTISMDISLFNIVRTVWLLLLDSIFKTTRILINGSKHCISKRI